MAVTVYVYSTDTSNKVLPENENYTTHSENKSETKQNNN